MAQITLQAKPRTVVGKQSKNLARTGLMPAVLYGHEVKSQNLEINAREFLKVFKQAGESTILSLKVEDREIPVLIHEVQNHYLKDHPTHVDFYAVNMKEKLTATIPLHFIGDAPAVKTLGGMLVKSMSEVEVECLPVDLPHAIEIEITGLNTFEDLIRVSDLKVSGKVKILAGPEEVVVTVAPPRTEEEMKALDEKVEAPDVTQVEGVAEPAPVAEGEAPAEAEAKTEKEKKAE